MSYYCNPDVLDAALDYIRGSDRLYFCTTQPTSASDAWVNGLAFTPAVIYLATKSAGDPDGRALIISSFGTTSYASGTATHIAFVNTSDDSVRYVVQVPDIEVAYPGNASYTGSKITFREPTAET